MSGDMYSLHLMVLLTFILGSALGNFLAIKYKNIIPLMEILTGFIMLIFACGYEVIWNNQFISYHPNISAFIFSICPALVLGMHVPFYSSYVKSKGFALGYFLYTIAGVFGIIALEMLLFIKVVPLSKLLMSFAIVQILFGLILAVFVYKNHISLKEISYSSNVINFVKNYKKQITEVFIFSTCSFIIYYWVMRTFSILMPPFRLNSSLLLAASLFMVSIGCFFEILIKKFDIKLLQNKFNIILFMIVTTTCSLLLYKPFMIEFSDIIPMHNHFYLIYNFCSAALLMLPCLWSNLFFTAVTSETMSNVKNEEMQIPSAICLIVAALGNIVGIIYGILFVKFLWEGYLYFLIPLFIIPLLIFALNKSNIKKRALVVFIILSITCIPIFNYFNSIKTIANIKAYVCPYLYLRKGLNLKVNFPALKYYVDKFSSVLLLPVIYVYPDYTEKYTYYIVDGYLSHTVTSSSEFVQGYLGSIYFGKYGPKDVLVIGMGSGETAFAASMFSQNVDVVDINPSVFKLLDFLKDYNANINNNANVNKILADGFFYVKNTNKKYDMVINTSTKPMNYNSNKLYTKEFIQNVKNILKDNGVYVTYDDDVIDDKKQLGIWLKPIQEQFKYIDLWEAPYVTAVAYNNLHNTYNFHNNYIYKKRVEKIDNFDFQEKFKDIHQFSIADINAKDYKQKYSDVPMNTRDYAIYENSCLKNYLNWYIMFSE